MFSADDNKIKIYTVFFLNWDNMGKSEFMGDMKIDYAKICFFLMRMDSVMLVRIVSLYRKKET